MAALCELNVTQGEGGKKTDPCEAEILKIHTTTVLTWIKQFMTCQFPQVKRFMMFP